MKTRNKEVKVGLPYFLEELMYIQKIFHSNQIIYIHIYSWRLLSKYIDQCCNNVSQCFKLFEFLE